MCSRWNATTCPERYSTYAFADDCGNCCRYVEQAYVEIQLPTDGKLKSEVLAEAGISISTAQRYKEMADSEGPFSSSSIAKLATY